MDYSSFELNQSCPTLGKKKQNTKLQTSLQSFAKFRGKLDELNEFLSVGVLIMLTSWLNFILLV